MPTFFARVSGFGVETERPVFVVGMPRSGTTLVEQILASHPRVFGAGELRLVRETFEAVPEAVRPLRGAARLYGVPRSERRAISGPPAPRASWRRSIDSADRVVDKMPENTLYLGSHRHPVPTRQTDSLPPRCAGCGAVVLDDSLRPGPLGVRPRPTLRPVSTNTSV